MSLDFRSLRSFDSTLHITSASATVLPRAHHRIPGTVHTVKVPLVLSCDRKNASREPAGITTSERRHSVGSPATFLKRVPKVLTTGKACLFTPVFPAALPFLIYEHLRSEVAALSLPATTLLLTWTLVVCVLDRARLEGRGPMPCLHPHRTRPRTRSKHASTQEQVGNPHKSFRALVTRRGG